MRYLAVTSVALSLLQATPVTTSPSPASTTHNEIVATQQRGSWRRLTENVIERIWGLPDLQRPITAAPDRSWEPLAPTRMPTATYQEDVVLRFNISTYDEATSLVEASRDLFLDVWEFTQDWADIRVAKEVVPSLLGLLPQSMQTTYRPLMTNLDLTNAILESYPSPTTTSPYETRRFSLSLDTPKEPKKTENIFFQNYQPLSVIEPWLNLMASMFPTHVRPISVGVTHEGRNIPGLRVGVHPTNSERVQPKRKTILIVGGSHAREWISTSTVNYVAWNLITSYGKDLAVTNLLEAYDWVFIPTLNPDGYVYTWETDRLWRKNRQPTSLRFCKGIDIDRSFSFHFDSTTSQSNPCSESFPGTKAFESTEAQRFAAWAKNETENNNVEFVTFLDLHSYSQQVLYPYSYTCKDDPPTLEDLEELALGLAKAIRLSRSGHFYQAIPACEGNVAVHSSGSSRIPPKKVYYPRLESGGGSALDWFYHEVKVKYAYQIKLRDTGSYGFLLPKEHIVPTGREMLDAVLYLGRYLMGEVGMEEGSRSGDVRLKDMERGGRWDLRR